MLDSNAHFHWMISAANTGQIDPIEITVLGYLDEKSALDAAKDLITRDTYRVIKVWECNYCKYQEAAISSQASMANILKKFLGK